MGGCSWFSNTVAAVLTGRRRCFRQLLQDTLLALVAAHSDRLTWPWYFDKEIKWE
jgi:hypothetical protein